MSDQISVAEYCQNILPAQFATAMADLSPEAAAQPEITSTYAISGAGGGTYGLRVANGQLEVVPGGIPNSDLYTTTTIENWLSGVVHIGEPLIRFVKQGKVNAVRNLRGALRLDIARADGSSIESTTVYGGTASPDVTIRMKADDYKALMNGSLNGQLAFMTGKLKFDGSLPFLLQLAAASF